MIAHFEVAENNLLAGTGSTQCFAVNEFRPEEPWGNQSPIGTV